MRIIRDREKHNKNASLNTKMTTKSIYYMQCFLNDLTIGENCAILDMKIKQKKEISNN